MASTPGAMWPAAKKVGKVLPLIRLKDTKVTKPDQAIPSSLFDFVWSRRPLCQLKRKIQMIRVLHLPWASLGLICNHPVTAVSIGDDSGTTRNLLQIGIQGPAGKRRQLTAGILNFL